MRDLTSFNCEELIALARLDIENHYIDGALAKIKTCLSCQDIPLEISSLAAKIYSQLRLFNNAKHRYQLFLSSMPPVIIEKFQLGLIYLESGHYKPARTVWRELLEYEPASSPTLYHGAIDHLTSRNKPAAERNLNLMLHILATNSRYFDKAKERVQQIQVALLKTNVHPKANENVYCQRH